MRRTSRTRPVFGIERLWTQVARVCPPFTVQLVVEGAPEAGTAPLDLPCLRRAVVDAARVNPGVCLRLEGHLGFSRWRAAGNGPPVIEVDGTRWSGRDEQGAPFLQKPLTPGGPTVEVLWVRGPVDRVVFRGHHAVVDGRGLLSFAEDVFAILRGEAPLGSTLDVTDIELAQALGTSRKRFVKPAWPPPTGAPEAVPAGTVMPWRRVRYDGSPRRLLPRLALAVHRASRQFTQDPLLIEVPVDLRRHLPEGVRTTANITGAARIELQAIVDAPDPVQAFVERLTERAAEPEAAAPIVDTQIFRWLPGRTTLRLLRRLRQGALKNGKVGASAILSNLGRYPLSRLSSPQHSACAWYWVPSGGPIVPLFILVTGDGQGVQLSVGMSPELASNNRLNTIVEGILNDLHRTAAELS